MAAIAASATSSARITYGIAGEGSSQCWKDADASTPKEAEPETFFKGGKYWIWNPSGKGRIYHVWHNKAKKRVSSVITPSVIRKYEKGAFICCQLVLLDRIKELPYLAKDATLGKMNIIMGRSLLKGNGDEFLKRLYSDCIHIDIVENLTNEIDFAPPEVKKAMKKSGCEYLLEYVYGHVGKIFMAAAVQLSKINGDKPIVLTSLGNAAAFYIQCGLLPVNDDLVNSLAELPYDDGRKMPAVPEGPRIKRSAWIARLVQQEKKQGRTIGPEVDFGSIKMYLPKEAYEKWKSDLEL